MISFNHLGNLGRLSNQMFQYASLMGISSNLGVEYCIPPKEIFGKADIMVKTSSSNIYSCFNIFPQNIGVTNYKNREELTFAFDETIFNYCEDNTNIIGYFQTEKYFKHIEKRIKKEFKFKNEIYEPSVEKFNKLFPNTEVISLHIRRGDYLNNPNHPVQSISYYINSLNLLDDNIPVIIFTDDPLWCNRQKIFDSDRFSISNSGDASIDLCLMTLCDYHIIANSSYSWWGSWLSNSKKTIAPKNWFSGNCLDKDTKDLYCSSWIIL